MRSADTPGSSVTLPPETATGTDGGWEPNAALPTVRPLMPTVRVRLPPDDLPSMAKSNFPPAFEFNTYSTSIAPQNPSLFSTRPTASVVPLIVPGTGAPKAGAGMGAASAFWIPSHFGAALKLPRLFEMPTGDTTKGGDLKARREKGALDKNVFNEQNW